MAHDPGKVWGWAQLRDGVFASGEQPYDDMTEQVELVTHYLTQCVCENFIITSQTARKTQGELWSPRGIGVVEHFCRRDDVPLKLQQPSAAKAFSSDEKLKRLGWYRSSKGGHMNDAARHLLLWLASEGKYDGDTVNP